ncbi:MAG: hypothetical protein ACE5Z5_11155, partial [Candidatus Bathyarchaeia archaeon]
MVLGGPHVTFLSTDALRHEDAIGLLQTLSLPKGTLSTRGRQLSRPLGVKNAAEYEESLITRGGASRQSAHLILNLIY